MLEKVEWGEFRLGDLFEIKSTKKLNYKSGDLPSKATGEYNLPALTSSSEYQGLTRFVKRDRDTTILKNVITIASNGACTEAIFYQNKEFTILQDAYALEWIYSRDELSELHNIYLVTAMYSALRGKYNWGNKSGWKKVKEEKIKLPICNDKSINFDFMEKFIAELEATHIAELEAYLNVTGLKDYELTEEEKIAVSELEAIEWNDFNLENLFGKSTR